MFGIWRRQDIKGADGFEIVGHYPWAAYSNGDMQKHQKQTYGT
jgi:hypothetical protein